MFWIGSKISIDAANAAATAHVVHPADQITTSWAVPQQAADGRWAIPAHPQISAPAGCTDVAAVTWPQGSDD